MSELDVDIVYVRSAIWKMEKWGGINEIIPFCCPLFSLSTVKRLFDPELCLLPPNFRLLITIVTPLYIAIKEQSKEATHLVTTTVNSLLYFQMYSYQRFIREDATSWKSELNF